VNQARLEQSILRSLQERGIVGYVEFSADALTAQVKQPNASELLPSGYN